MKPANRQIHCPVCSKAVALEPRSKWFPFCSQECKWIDLGRWIDQRYAVDMRTGKLGVVEDESLTDDDDDNTTIH